MNAAKRLKPLIDEAKRNPRVQVSLWEGGTVEMQDETVYYGRSRYTTKRPVRVGGKLVRVECTRPRRKPVKPKGIKRSKPPAPAKLGRARLERAEKIKPGKWFVRFGYLSEGEELLYVDEGPMAYGTAQALHNTYGGLLFKQGEAPSIHKGRKVVLPSQQVGGFRFWPKGGGQ